ncbi:GAF domain-containing sensor histidine kinase [Alishewanella sp. HL-SH05]|uniref:GAF domain-containing sensor histidine kinase n=1 Tax=Alishewanella sp. HL-SH05 TaxID=3461145 RepID=UPI0040427283
MNNTLEGLLLALSMDPLLDSDHRSQAESVLLQTCLQGIKVSRASIWLYSDENSTIACKLLCTQAGISTHDLPTLNRTDYPSYFAALDKKRVITAPDARSDPATCEFNLVYLEPCNIYSLLDVPLRYKGEVIGIICCEQTQQPRLWSDSDAAFVGALSDLYGRIVAAAQRHRYQVQLETANARLESQVQERTQHLQAALDQLKQTQHHLIESEKMASLGSLVVGVAHEINTPIGVGLTANSHSQYVLEKVQRTVETGGITKQSLKSAVTDLLQSCNIVERNLERAAGLIQQFKQTALDQAHFELHAIDIDDYISALSSTLQSFCRQHQVELQLQLSSGLSLNTFPGALAQVITNLVTNACLHAFEQATQPALVNITTRVSADQQLCIVVSDNGCGIPRSHQQKIFDPFFTTKRGRGGTGLGLSIVYNIVKQHLKGELSLHSEPAQGCRFSLTIPNLH